MAFMSNSIFVPAVLLRAFDSQSPTQNKKAELSQRWPRDASHIWCPENFRESLSTPTAILFPKSLMDMFGSILWMT